MIPPNLSRSHSLDSTTPLLLPNLYEPTWLSNIKDMGGKFLNTMNSPTWSSNTQGGTMENSWCWKLLSRRAVSSLERNKKAKLLHMLENWSVCGNTIDKPTWKLTREGVYSVKSFHCFLSSRGVIWKSLAFHKVKDFSFDVV